jgi:hypothetical protein
MSSQRCAQIGEWRRPRGLVTVNLNRSRNVEANVLNVWSRRVKIPNIEIKEIQDHRVLNKTCRAADPRQEDTDVSGGCSAFICGCNNVGSLILELLAQRQTKTDRSRHTQRGTGSEISKPAARQPAQLCRSRQCRRIPHGSHDPYKSVRVGRQGNRVPFPVGETHFPILHSFRPLPWS